MSYLNQEIDDAVERAVENWDESHKGAVRSSIRKFARDVGVEKPTPMILFCPLCHMRHVDKGEFAIKPHHTHACQNCGVVWRPAVVLTVGVAFLPGFKDAP